ncbi:MAG: patatin-like phospholipase family protein [Thermoanaerobaculia bacterium]
MRSRAHPFVRSGTFAASIALLAACTSASRPPLDLARLQSDGEATERAHRERIAAVIEKLAQRALARGDGKLDILLLSGGGQNGAYGAGFLRGWQKRDADPMPTFDLVSGISVGALQAPFAFLGTDESTERLAGIFREAGKTMETKIDHFFWLHRTGGIVKMRGYYDTLSQVYDEPLAASLRPGFAEGRQLLIGSTDADLGIGRLWNLESELAASGGVERMRCLLRATTAIPGYFPPILVDGHLHIDGGVTNNLLTVLDLEDYRRLEARLRELGAAPVTVRIWTILNVWPHPTPKVMPPGKATSIAVRGTYLLYWAQQPETLRGLVERASAVNSELEGVRLEVRFTGIPDELSTDPAADKLFDPAWTKRLETLGYERARGESPWDPIPSGYARPE